MIKTAAAACVLLFAVPALIVVMLLTGHPPAALTTPQHVPGIPQIVLNAYTRAAALAPRVVPRAKGIRWAILAGIGKIESNHLAGRRINPDGTVRPPFLGPRLDGSGAGGNTSPIYDTDHGRYDGDTVYDRAVGLMQFIPGTWHRGGYSGPRGDGRDGNNDGVADPNNVYDSALAAVVHLAGNQPVDFTDRRQLAAAIYRYNHAHWYVRKVLTHIDHYDQLTPTLSVPGTGRAATAVHAALRWLGTPYSWGGGTIHGPSYGFAQGAGIKGFDCSSLTQYAWHKAGIKLGRVTYDQWRQGTRIPAGREQPGDLIFMHPQPQGPGHVGLVIGNGKMVHAPHTGDHIRIASYRSRAIVGFVRVYRRWARAL